MWRGLCCSFFVIGLIGCPATTPGVGDPPEPWTCQWTDRDVYRDLPSADTVDDLAAGALVAAQHVATVDALTLSLKAGVDADFDAEVYRVIYVSELDGRRSLVTARLAFPGQAGPGTVRGLVGHQHGTFGFADPCAPSKLDGFGFESELNPLAAWAVAQNMAVVMTDGPGLGVPGPHPYVVRAPTGRAVLDGLSAAQTFCDEARGVRAPGAVPVVLEGHSQGAHATVAALVDEALQGDARPWDIRAAVAIALPVRHRSLLLRMSNEEDVEPALVAMGILGQIHHRPDTFGRYEDWFVPDVVDWLHDRIDEACAPEMSARLTRPAEQIFLPDVLDSLASADFEALGVADALDDESVDRLPHDIPLLVLHGDQDSLLPLEVVQEQMGVWTADDRAVELTVVEGADHWVLPSLVREEVFAFVESAL